MKKNEITHSAAANTAQAPSINEIRKIVAKYVTREESEKSHDRKLRDGYEKLLYPYAPYVTTAVTLTIKKTAILHTVEKTHPDYKKRFHRVWLGEDELTSTMRYLTARLNHYCFGNAAKHKNKRDKNKLLLLFFVEGDGIYKRKHFHLAVGNIPEKHKSNIRHIIKLAWQECDFANREIEVEDTYDSFGWLKYDVKEVEEARNADVFNVVHSCIPRFIEEIVCTECRS